MTREERENAIRCLKLWIEREPYIQTYKTCLEALEQEPKWTPCSEKMPEEGVDVLACFYTGEGNYKMMVSRRSDYNYWSGVGRTADMVAWMPLPKPYEQQEISDRNLKMWEELFGRK